MRRVTLRSLWAHKRRLVSTVLAVVLGVSFMSGTFIISTTIDQSFDDLFSQVVEKVDVVVQGQVLYSDLLTGDARANLPASLATEVAAVPGVAAAHPYVSTKGSISFNRVLGADGEPIGGGQSSTVLESWIDDDDISPYHLVHGDPPAADGEIVLNQKAAEDGDLHVGDEVRVVTQQGPQTFRLVGTFALGAAKSAGGAITVGMTLDRAQEIAGIGDQINAVYLRADGDESREQLVQRVQREASGAEVVTGDEAAAQQSEESQTNFQFLTLALTIFGAIALLVGIFVISNTFAILVAQRTKELALLRALGAGRGQVLGSVLLEAAVVGAGAAVLGVLGGLGLAKGVTGVMSAAGAALPNAKLVVEPDSILLSLAIGVTVTMLASLLPAVRATRVPPLAALRDVAVDRTDVSRVRLGGGALLLVVGAFNLSASWRADGSTAVVPQVGVGGLLVVVGCLLLGPVLAGRTVKVIGSPLPRFRGVTGRLATENAARSPRRTSATASAVVIGVALVVFIQVFAASAAVSVRHEIERNFAADLVVNSKPEGLMISPGIPSGIAEVLRGVEGIETVSALGFGSVGIQYTDGKTATHFATAIDPEGMDEVFTPRMAQGDVGDLTDDGVFIDRRNAQSHHLRLGDPIVVIAPGGKSAQLRLEGVSDDRNLLGNITLTRTQLAALNPQVVDVQVAAKIAPGAELDTVIRRAQRALADYPSVQVLDKDGFIGNLIDQITSYITLIQGMLILSVITALFGIANTLSLSIGERTRELGLLRAVGMDRRDIQSAVRWEAVLISVLGGLIGIAVGLFVSIGVVKAMQGYGLARFALPGGVLGVILLVTALMGTVASTLPAWRAARLSNLDAIAAE
jgi:putative ABC transport system permease protein